MSQHNATIIWERNSQIFIDNRYSRSYIWKLDGGTKIVASSSPTIVPLPYSHPEAIDPEEAFVAAISSCHMLWFLSIAVKHKFCIDVYIDNAFGEMQNNEKDVFYIRNVTLQPKNIFSGVEILSQDKQITLHEEAHSQCYIANSVRSKIVCRPIF